MVIYALHDAMLKPMPGNDSGIGRIAGFAWSGPYEDVKLKAR